MFSSRPLISDHDQVQQAIISLPQLKRLIVLFSILGNREYVEMPVTPIIFTISPGSPTPPRRFIYGKFILIRGGRHRNRQQGP